MKLFTHIAGKPATAIAVGLLAAASLAACGGDSGYGQDTEPPKPAVDAYFIAVSAIAASSPDDGDPGAIDTVGATAPEETEAQPLG